MHQVGRIDLPIRLGEKGEGQHMVVEFFTVEEVTAYNHILGRPTLNESKAVIIPSFMLMKFERDDGSVGALRGDQKMSTECYLSYVRPMATTASHNVEPSDLDNKEVAPTPKAAGQKRKEDKLAPARKTK